MITFSQVQSLKPGDIIHFGTCRTHKGPRGGVSKFLERWRVNGRLKTAKRNPNWFSLPIKYGLKYYTYLTDANARFFHLESECPELSQK